MPGGHAFKFASSMTIRLYGKNQMVKEVSKTLPAYKEVKFIIKKYKVPIVAPTGVFLLALQSIANPPLEIGESYDWNTVLSYLKACGLIKHGGQCEGAWELTLLDTGEILCFDKQDSIKVQMALEPEFGDRVRASIIKAVLGGKSILETE